MTCRAWTCRAATYRAFVLALVPAVVAINVAVAQSTPAASHVPSPSPPSGGWAAQMFSEHQHDFGVVARGAEVVHLIAVKNVFKDEVHIASVKTACGCTAAEASKTTLASGESATIRIEMDTVRFSKQKDSAVIVTFDRPQFAEVRIPINVYIRTDVVIQPGTANFGSVDLGTAGSTSVSVAYAGRPDWRILEVKTFADHLTAEVVETKREGGSVEYDVNFHLAGTAPEGTFQQQVQLITDDENAPKVPLLVEARVETDLTVSPRVVAIGTVAPGSVVRKTVVMRGREPFAIEKIECESALAAFATKLPDDTRAVHVLPLTFTAPDTEGDFEEQFTVTIPGRPEPLVFKAYGTIARN